MLVNRQFYKNNEDIDSNVVISIKWHPRKDILSVASTTALGCGFLSFYTKEGGKPFYSTTAKSENLPECISWHPIVSVLAVGWSSGIITLIDPLKKIENVVSIKEIQKIQYIIWSLQDSILLIIDVKGNYKAFKLVNLKDLSSELSLLNKGSIFNEVVTDVIAKLINKEIFNLSKEKSKKKTIQNIHSSDETLKKKSSLTLSNEFHENDTLYNEEKNLQQVTSNTEANNCIFFIATNKGALYILDVINNDIFQIFQAESAFCQLLNISVKNYVLAITEGMMFYQLYIEGKLAKDIIKVKLTGKKENFSIIYVGLEMIAFCYGEPEIRIWDLKNEESFIFLLTVEKNYTVNDQIIFLSYCPTRDVITGATKNSKIATWKRQKSILKQSNKTTSIENHWHLQSASFLNLEKIFEINWSQASSTLAVNTGNNVQIFVYKKNLFCVDLDFAIIQVSSQHLLIVRITDPTETFELQVYSDIDGFFLSKTNLILWDSNKIQLYQIFYSDHSPLYIQKISSFDINYKTIIKAIFYDNYVYIINANDFVITTTQGTLKKTVSLKEVDGLPQIIDLNNNWLCIGTSKGFFLIYDLNDENFKLIFHSCFVGKLNDKPWEKFAVVKINSQGNRISFTIYQDEIILDKLFVWEVETNSINCFSFQKKILNQHIDQNLIDEKNLEDDLSKNLKISCSKKLQKQMSHYKISKYSITNHFWDCNDPRFLICEANCIESAIELENTVSKHIFLTFFVTTEHGIQFFDSEKYPIKIDSLIFVNVPYIYLLKNKEFDEPDEINVEKTISNFVMQRTLQEFVEVDKKDTKAIQAILNFNFFLCIEQMDNAFKEIKYIRNQSVWEHMARMCVKTRRIDVARVCLSYMQNWRAVQTINASVARKDSLDFQAAKLAVELNMIDEAKEIFIQIKRYDILNKLYQAEGNWTKAFEIAKKYDRINLRHTHFNYGRFLESKGDIEAAIKNYELAHVHHFEVPRMLFHEPKALEYYIVNKEESALYKWWAQYLESIGDLESAKKFYSLANDFFSVVRILCVNNKTEQAIDVVNKSNNRAAAFHLANYLESNAESTLAVQYFIKAEAYSSAIRLAIQFNMTKHLANFALMAGEGELIKVGNYYEKLPGHADKAVMFYHKAGMIGKAIDLAFETEQLSALDLIAQDLNASSDPAILERAAQFFVKNQRHQTAVQLLIYAKKFSQAVALCVKRNVKITEELDKLFTSTELESLSVAERLKLYNEIAHCCLQQGNYHFAAKKFTQAGNKVEAMRALLKSGDTERIIIFANTARNKDIYKMVANYLQTLNWKEDADLMRQIEKFYVKADAFESLANFYEACAQVEIDDYHDYEKALCAYNEAFRCLNKEDVSKIDGASILERRNVRIQFQEKQEKISAIINKIRQFLDAKQIYNNNPGEALSVLGEIANETNINEIIRLGDILSFIILHNVNRRNYKKAYQIIEQNQHSKIDFQKFLSKEVLDKIYSELNIQHRTTNIIDDDDDNVNTVEYSRALQRQMPNITKDF